MKSPSAGEVRTEQEGWREGAFRAGLAAERDGLHLLGDVVHVGDVGSPLRIGKDAHIYQLSQLFGVVIGGERGVVTLLDLLAQRIQAHLVPVEGALKGSHLIEEAAERPDVRLEVVPVLVNPLRRHVVRGAH